MKNKILALLLTIAATEIAIAQSPTDSGFPKATRRPTKVFTEAVNWNNGVTYTYDGAGNIRSIGTDAQVYDAAGRLVRSTINGVTWEYSYDAFGNRKTCDAPGTDCQYGMTIDRATNRIDDVSNNVSYDAAGNMLSLEGRSFTWDAMDVMTRASGNGVDREFVYTPDDERIAVYDVGSTWHWSARDLSGKVLRDFTSQDNGANLASANWTWVKDYVYRDGLLVASRQKLTGNPTPVTWHYHLDHLGTPRRITTDSDAVIGSHTYHAFGPETADGLNEPSPTRMKFTGHERDLEAGGGLVELDYMHARYYNGALGRFLSVDPTWESADLGTPQTWNRYAYVRNNPINRVDPDGRLDGNSDDVARQLFPGDRAAQAAFDQQVAEGTAKLSGAFLLALVPGPEDVPLALVGATKAFRAVARFFGRGAAAVDDIPAPAAAGTGRAKNKLKPDASAQGPHSTFKKNSAGQVTGTATYQPNPRNPSGFDEVKRVDVTGKAHRNPDGTVVPTPHVKETGKKGVRPATDDDLPKDKP